MTKRVWIPAVAKDELIERSKRVRPVITKDGAKTYLEPVDPFTVAYLWSPKPVAEPVPPLVPLGEAKTYHSYGYYGFFKPSIGEVLAQIPADILDKVVAFEIVKAPEDAADLNDENEALNAGYHVANTLFYGVAS